MPVLRAKQSTLADTKTNDESISESELSDIPASDDDKDESDNESESSDLSISDDDNNGFDSVDDEYNLSDENTNEVIDPEHNLDDDNDTQSDEFKHNLDGSTSSDEDSGCGSGGEHPSDPSRRLQRTHKTPDAEDSVWGANEKDWTEQTALTKWLHQFSDYGAAYLAELKNMIADPNVTLEVLEAKLPPPEVTDFYWQHKHNLARLRGGKILLVISHCPQYNVSIANMEQPEIIQPEDSTCFTSAVISWIARTSRYPLFIFNMRHNCRKEAPRPRDSNHTKDAMPTENAKRTGAANYASCEGTRKSDPEARHLVLLADILVEIAERRYNLEIVTTLTFSTMARAFASTLAVPTVALNDHICRLRNRSDIALLFAMQITDVALSLGSVRDIYESLRLEMLRLPSKDAGRCVVKLRPFERVSPSTLPTTLEGLLSTLDEHKVKRREQKYQQRRNNPDYYARGKAAQAKQRKSPEHLAKMRNQYHANLDASRARARKANQKRAPRINKARRENYRDDPAYRAKARAAGRISGAKYNLKKREQKRLVEEQERLNEDERRLAEGQESLVDEQKRLAQEQTPAQIANAKRAEKRRKRYQNDAAFKAKSLAQGKVRDAKYRAKKKDTKRLAQEQSAAQG